MRFRNSSLYGNVRMNTSPNAANVNIITVRCEMKGLKKFVCLVAAVALATAVFGCGKAETKKEAETTQAINVAEQVSVKVTIDGSKGEDKAISCEETLELQGGSTVYDALAALCDKNGFEITGEPSYIKTIGGLGEGSFGSTACGWMFTVNGNYSTDTADVCQLNDGDDIVWTFMK